MIAGGMTIKMRNQRRKVVPLPNLTSLVFMSSIMCTWVRVEVLPPVSRLSGGNLFGDFYDSPDGDASAAGETDAVVA